MQDERLETFLGGMEMLFVAVGARRSRRHP